MKPVLTVLAGANGSGKSFFSDFFVSQGFVSTQPVNIDALESRVDTNLIPDDPLRYAKTLKVEIDKIFNSLCREAIKEKKDFAYECNLRADQLSCVRLFEEAGYSINLLYIWLDSIDISIERVNIRVNEGGHMVGLESVKRDYYEGIINLDFSVSEKHWDHVYIIDNSRSAKTKGDALLLLLLEADKDKVIQFTDNFFNWERAHLLPSICKMLKAKIQ